VSAADPAAAAQALRRYKPFATLIKDVGPPPAVKRTPTAVRYPALVESIVYQQLAGAAASAIHGRLVAGCGGTVTPASIDATNEDALIAFGLSGAKRRAIRDLTRHVDEELVRFDRHGRMDDEAVIAELTQVIGIGIWTAQMYLLFCLGRPDVWPTGDLGVRYGWSLLHGLDEPISAKELEAAGAHLAPYRSAAAWYCWERVHIERGQDNGRANR
jgi:DNA-3-methyladenine glycosylase II